MVIKCTPPVSEPVKERNEVFEIRYHQNCERHGVIAFFNSEYDKEKIPAIKQAIESALNDTVVEDSHEEKYYNLFSIIFYGKTE